MDDCDEITRLLTAARAGDGQALEQLIPVVYQDLRRLASHYMQLERPDHTLQATALVHEVYLRLVGRDLPPLQDRAHFFAVAAQLMRRLLLDHARARGRAKRGGDVHCPHHIPEPQAARDDRLLAIEDALDRLAATDPRQGKVVELRCFVGLSIEEIATVLGVSARTVKREWQMAKAWLRAEVEG